jgi:Tol biopolymer transport system component
LAAFAAGVALTVAAALALGVRAPREGPDLRVTPFSVERGGQQAAVWSPDGRRVAFAARQQQTEPYQVYVRDLDSHLARRITNAKNDAVPIQWTTTGHIIFWSDTVVSSVLPVGGEAEPLLELRNAPVVAVSRDGLSVAYIETDEEGDIGIRVRSPLTAEPHRYEPAPFEARLDWLPELAFSPDGTQLLLLTSIAGWVMPYPADPKNPPRRILESLGAPTSGGASHQFSWLNDRHIVVASASLGPMGSEDLIIADTRSGNARTVRPPGVTSITELAASPDGSKVVLQDRIADDDIVNLSLEDATVTPLITTARNEGAPAWAAGGTAMVYVTNRNGSGEIWLHEQGEEDRPIVTADDFSGVPQLFGIPSLAPDMTRVIYFSAAIGGPPGSPASPAGLYISAVTGGAPVLLAATTTDLIPGSWSPDGTWFVYSQGSGREPTTLKKVRTSGRAEPETLRTLSVQSRLPPKWSPQGDWILYGDRGLKLISPDGGTVRELGFGASCTFARDGGRLYCLAPPSPGRSLLRVDLDGNVEQIIGSVANEDGPSSSFGVGHLTVTPDGVNVTYSVHRSSTSLSLLEGLDTVPLP